MKKLLKINLLLCLFGVLFMACSSSDDDPDPGPVDPGIVDPTELSTPANLKSVTEDEIAGVDWDEVENADGYVVSLNDGEELPAKKNYYAFSELEPLTTYSWKVKAVRTQKDGTILSSEWAKSSFTTEIGDTVNYTNLWIGDWKGRGVTAKGYMTIMLLGSQEVDFNQYMKMLDTATINVAVAAVSEGSREVSFELKGLDTLFTMPDFTARPRKTGISQKMKLNENRVINLDPTLKLAQVIDSMSLEGAGGLLGDNMVQKYLEAFRTAEVDQIDMTVTSVSMTGKLAEENSKMEVSMVIEGKITFSVIGLEEELARYIRPMVSNLAYSVTVKTTLTEEIYD